MLLGTHGHAILLPLTWISKTVQDRAIVTFEH